MGYLGGREQLGCGVGADRHAGAATDAGRRVESGVAMSLAERESRQLSVHAVPGRTMLSLNALHTRHLALFFVPCCPRKDHVVTPRC